MAQPYAAGNRDRCGRNTGYPVCRAALEMPAHQQGVIVALDQDQCITLDVLSRDKPGFLRAAGYSPDTEPLALADGVVGDALVLVFRQLVHQQDRPGGN